MNNYSNKYRYTMVFLGIIIIIISGGIVLSTIISDSSYQCGANQALYNVSFFNETISGKCFSINNSINNITNYINGTTYPNISNDGLTVNISVPTTVNLLTTENTFGYIIMKNNTIEFYNISGTYKGKFWWQNDRTNTITSSMPIFSADSISSQSDLFTTGTGDDLWLGTSTLSIAEFRAYANGNLGLGNTTETQQSKINQTNFCIGTSGCLYPLTVSTNSSSISAWFQGNLSATGYNVRTSVYDKSKGAALNYIVDSDTLKDVNGKVLDNIMYGSVGTAKELDYSRPVNEIVFENVLNDKTGVLENHNYTITTYPYYIEVQQVSIDQEINMLKQALYELKIGVCTTNSTGTSKSTKKFVTQEVNLTNSVVRAPVHNLTFPLVANKLYEIRCRIMTNTNVTANGVRMHFNITGTTARAFQSCETRTSGTAVYQLGVVGNVLSCASTASIGANLPTPFFYEAMILEDGSASNFTIYLYGETATSTTYRLYEGSMCEFEQLT